MKKLIFLETIQFHPSLTGGTAPPDQKSRYPLKLINQVASAFYDANLLNIYNYVNQKKKQDFDVFDQYTKNYNVISQLDPDRGLYYFPLPASLAAIPNYIAIRKLHQYKGENYSQIDSTLADSYKNLPLMDDDMFFLEGNKCYMPNDHEPKNFIVSLVVAFSAFSNQDEVTMPIGQRGTILELTINALINRIPQDKLDNTNPDESQRS